MKSGATGREVPIGFDQEARCLYSNGSSGGGGPAIQFKRERLARVLLLMANFGKEGRPEPVIPKISQETLAKMVGTLGRA